MPSSLTYDDEKVRNEITQGREMTPLQKHVAFFDRNKDGKIYPWETFQGFRAIGCSIPISFGGALVVNGFLGPPTFPGKFPSLFFPVHVKNIHKSIHGSDTGVYDKEGRFVQEKFEAIFDNHARTHGTALTKKELHNMMNANREPRQYKEWMQSRFNWGPIYDLCKDKNGLLHKSTVRSIYDGTVFMDLERERLSKPKKKFIFF